MGDTKTQKETENVEKKESGSLIFRELRDDLFREASELVAENPSTKIAILFSDPSSESGVSMHSFGHPSVDGVVKKFLEDVPSVPVPVDSGEKKDPLSPRFWWEDKKLHESTDPEELRAAIDAITRMKNSLVEAMNNQLTDQGSEDEEDLDDEKAGPKP